MMKLQRYRKRLKVWIDGRPLKERALIFTTVLAGLYVIAVHVVFAQLSHSKQQTQQAIATKSAEIQGLNSEFQQLALAAQQDPDAVNRARLTQLQTEIHALEGPLANLTAGLVNPQEMVRMVETILVNDHGLKLMQVENLPAQPLLPNMTDTTQQQEVGPLIYKHGVRIKVSGKYWDIVGFLQALEGLQWKVLWNEVALETQQHPISSVTLVLYTLSLDQAWMGV